MKFCGAYKKRNTAKEVYIRLKKDYFDHLILVAVDGDGETFPCGALGTFAPNSTGKLQFYLESGVNPNLGFDLDDTGKLKVYS